MRLRAFILAGATLVGSVVFVTLASAGSPVLTLPTPPVVYTTGATAVVQYTVTASDNGTPVTPSCTPASGSEFPRGLTTVGCTADNGLGDPIGSGSFVVTVVGPPQLSLPANITVGEQNANVTFAVSASDELGNLAPVCSVSSPHLFPLGTTTVTCSANRNQPGSGSASGSFNVTVLDTTPPPDPTLTAPNGTITDPTPTFTFVSSGADGFVCALTGPTTIAATPCSSPYTSPTLADGSYTFSVSARDTAGNASGAASASFTVDRTPPPTPTITGPTGATADATPTFAFASAGATSYVCAFDNAAPTVACGSPQTAASALADGAHTFSVAARDAVGNTSTVATTSFTVDTTPPQTNIDTVVAPLTASRAASIAFSASEGGSTFSCRLDGGAFASCSSPSALSALADGSHTFTVRAADAVGNVDATPASVSWVVDATPPVLSPVGSLDKTVEADGPNGTRVTFAVTASDGGLALLPSSVTCAPLSASLFPHGTTPVICHAPDAAGNVGTLTFKVAVVDTTPPAINAPNVSFTATDSQGIAATAPAVAAYLKGISASDLVSTPTVTTNAPAVFRIGVTTLIVTARDADGNTATANVTVTVLAPGTVAPPADLTPPDAVSSIVARAGDHQVALSWGPPAKDVARVEVRQSIVGEQGAPTLIYKGLAHSFTSKKLQNGSTYRFVFVAFDAAGNSSPTKIVNATPKALLLARPLPGARVSAPPMLRWAPAPSAYFNVQLYRGGVKILTAWPTLARLQLTETWTFKGKTMRLKPGIYTWYVWPGIGARANARYADLLGKSSFVVVAKGSSSTRP